MQTDDQLELYALGRLPDADLPISEEHLMSAQPAGKGWMESAISPWGCGSA